MIPLQEAATSKPSMDSHRTIAAYLCVLLILRMKVVNGVLYDIVWIHRFLQRTGYALQIHWSTG